jgi:hypothetical protein
MAVAVREPSTRHAQAIAFARRLSRIAGAGPAVMEIALADKIATLRHAAVTGTPISYGPIARLTIG